VLGAMAGQMLIRRFSEVYSFRTSRGPASAAARNSSATHTAHSECGNESVSSVTTVIGGPRAHGFHFSSLRNLGATTDLIFVWVKQSERHVHRSPPSRDEG
jgi:hypothetical protein